MSVETGRKCPGETGGCLILHFRGNGIVYRRWINTEASWFCSAGDGGRAESFRCWKWYGQFCFAAITSLPGKTQTSLFCISTTVLFSLIVPWKSVFLQNIRFLIYLDNLLFFGDCRNLPTIMSWVQAQRPGVDGVNIITSDFVELTDFANIVIRLNDLLLTEQGTKSRWHTTYTFFPFYFERTKSSMKMLGEWSWIPVEENLLVFFF